MTASIIAFDDAKAERYLREALLMFYADPPDSDHQCGYEAALATVYVECLQGPVADDRLQVVIDRALPHGGRL